MTAEQVALMEAIKVAGGQSKLAKALSLTSGTIVKQQQVWNWLNREKRAPIKQAIRIEKATGISKERLRPDCFTS